MDMKITNSVIIKNDPEIVFSWLENPEKAMTWMSSVTKTEIITRSADIVGTTFRETVEDESGAVEMMGTISAFQPGKLIAFHLESKVNVVDVEYSVTGTPGGSLLDYDATIQWKFPVNIISLFIGKKMKESIIAQSDEEFEKLKDLCENGINKM